MAPLPIWTYKYYYHFWLTIGLVLCVITIVQPQTIVGVGCYTEISELGTQTFPFSECAQKCLESSKEQLVLQVDSNNNSVSCKCLDALPNPIDNSSTCGKCPGQEDRYQCGSAGDNSFSVYEIKALAKVSSVICSESTGQRTESGWITTSSLSYGLLTWVLWCGILDPTTTAAAAAATVDEMTAGNAASSTTPSTPTAELVTGVCPAGTFGTNCSGVCRCANQAGCNSLTGACDDKGCAPGYISRALGGANNCQTACPVGFYGSGCLEVCKCADNNKECNPVSGCTGAKCAPGYENPPRCTAIQSTNSNSQETSDSAAGDFLRMYMVPIIGGVAGLLVLILIILICVFINRKRRQKSKTKRPEKDGFDETHPISQDPGDSGREDSMKDGLTVLSPPRPVSLISNGGVATVTDEYVQMLPDPPIDLSLSVSDLENHIKKVRDCETMPFKEEYEKIPEGQTSPWDFGMKKNVHREKNRFGNIVAYDHTRVKLTRKKDDASEYINADYIDGYKQENAFIATQGPMPQTVDDFWRMCWEHNVPIIVMVTNCIENGRQKSEQYWPDVKQTKTCGDITIYTAEEEIFSDFKIRTLTMKKGEDPARKVKHYQFTGWPDHGVPRQATPLLTLRRRVRSDMTNKAGVSGPTAVHCSAGVGRSGTFIAVDYLMNQADAEGRIDVFGCVWHMRYKRVNMVQTWDQYNFIYDALLEAVTVGATTIPCYRFEEIYPTWIQPDPSSGVTKLAQQLRILDVVKQKLGDNELETALKSNNKNKNRREDVLPANFYRPFLQTRVDGTTDYINAVFVQGYYKREAFLITQAPLADTRVDFWRMVFDYDCRSIICLQDYEQNTLPPVWPEKGSLNFGPMIITFVRIIDDLSGLVKCIELTLKLGKRKSEESRTVMLFTLTEFPENDDDASLLSDKSQIAIKDSVQRWQQQSADQTVVVMCKYGFERCGVYCALDYVIDMMGVEQEVDVFQAVRQVQMSRPQLVHNIEQYQYLYDTAKTYMDIHMAYSNFQ